jgi:3-dehydroquinate dehydratase/shikimate dehydrogenase
MLIGVVRKNRLEECRALLRRPEMSQFDLLELRLDVCADLTIEGAASLLDSAPRPVIFTLRGRDEGGGFGGSEEERLDLLEKLIRLRPDAMDLEAHIPAERIARIYSLSPGTGRIVSRHDFAQTPSSTAGLRLMLEEMRRRFDDPQAIYKVATLARNTLDALRMLVFCREQRQRGLQLAGIAMGEDGQSTRILANWAHGTLAYCPADRNDASTTSPASPSSPTSPSSPDGLGHIFADELCDTYNYRRTGKDTRVYGLIGDPVAQSLGHIYHNAANKAAGCDAVYVKWRLEPGELEEGLALFRRLGVQGLSVTMPLKAAVLPHIGSRSDDVRVIGAANTLRLQPDGWRGANTDGAGATETLPFSLRGKSVAVLGAGGAARAFMLEAGRRGARLLVFNRSTDKALPGLPPDGAIRPLDRLSELGRLSYDLIVNALPRHLDVPFEQIPFRPGRLALDLSYNKASRFLALAAAAGCATMDGTEMFYRQAALQRAFWGLPG